MRNAEPDGNAAALRQYELEYERALRRSEEIERRITAYEIDPDFNAIREALQRHHERIEDILYSIWFDMPIGSGVRECRDRIRWTIREIVEAEEVQL